jgi:hypothetical protein
MGSISESCEYQSMKLLSLVGFLMLGLDPATGPYPVPDLPLCLGVTVGQGGGGPIFLPKKIFYGDFLLMWYNF